MAKLTCVIFLTLLILVVHPAVAAAQQTFFDHSSSGWLEEDVYVGAAGAQVGELHFAGRVHRHVFVAAVLADDHTFVDFVAGEDR